MKRSEVHLVKTKDNKLAAHQRIGHYSTEHYRGHEKHIASKIFLIPEQKNDYFLEVKEHLFSFKFQLPRILPNSFEHPYGRTRYQCFATLDIPWCPIEYRIFIIN
jgi:hypothetical protein